jgi:hypothetical protein
MTRQIACCNAILWAAAFAACGDNPQAPSALPQQAPATAAPNPPAPNPGGSSTGLLYSLTLTIGTACAVVPETHRTRTYTARIDNREGGIKVVTLSESTFLAGLICTGGSGRFAGVGCDQFFASEDIDTMQFFLENNNDEAHGGHIVERLSSGGWVEIIGNATGKIEASSVDAAGSGNVWYCPTSLPYPFPCNAFLGCPSTDIRLKLTRR